MGEQGVNLQDERYGFRCQITQAMREIARRAMRAGVSKNFRQREIDRKRALVKSSHFVILKIYSFSFSKILIQWVRAKIYQYLLCQDNLMCG